MQFPYSRTSDKKKLLIEQNYIFGDIDSAKVKTAAAYMKLRLYFVTAKKFGVASQYLTLPSFSGRSIRLAFKLGGNVSESKIIPAFFNK